MKKVFKHEKKQIVCTAITLLLVFASTALASSSEYAYISGVEKFVKSLQDLSGWIAAGAFFIAAVMVAFGGEMTGWVKTMVNTCVAVGTAATAEKLYQTFFGKTAAITVNDLFTTYAPIIQHHWFIFFG